MLWLEVVNFLTVRYLIWPSAAPFLSHITNQWRLPGINIVIIRPHRRTTYVDATYCYRPSIVVCRSVCLSQTRRYGHAHVRNTAHAHIEHVSSICAEFFTQHSATLRNTSQQHARLLRSGAYSRLSVLHYSYVQCSVTGSSQLFCGLTSQQASGVRNYTSFNPSVIL